MINSYCYQAGMQAAPKYVRIIIWFGLRTEQDLQYGVKFNLGTVEFHYIGLHYTGLFRKSGKMKNFFDKNFEKIMSFLLILDKKFHVFLGFFFAHSKKLCPFFNFFALFVLKKLISVLSAEIQLRKAVKTRFF